MADDDTAQGWVEYTADAGHSRVAVDVLFHGDVDTRCLGLDDGERCRTGTDVTGSVVMTRDDPAAGYRSATAIRKDGFTVMVSSQIAAAGDAQPLSLDQLVTAATSTAWQPRVDAGLAAKAVQPALARPPASKTAPPTS
jgi:hypothetical protein